MSAPRVWGAALFWTAVSASFVATRLAFLARPLFLDEALVLTWAARDLDDALAKGLGHGRPLLIAALWPLVRVVRALDLPEPWALVACARGLALVVSAAGAAATVALARALDRRAARPAAVLIAACPMRIFHDAQFLADVWLTACVALGLLVTWRFLERPDRKRAAAVVGAVALAALAKTPGALLALAPLGVAVVEARRRLSAALATTLAATVPAALVIAQVAAEREQLVTFEAARVRDVIGWLWTWLSWPVVLLVAVGAIDGWRRRTPGARSLALALALALIGLGAVSPLYPRYALPALAVALPLAALGAAGLLRSRIGVAALAVLAIPVALDATALLAGSTALLPKPDREQYLGAASGRGSQSAAQALVDACGPDARAIVWIDWSGDVNAVEAWRARTLAGYFAGSRRFRVVWGPRPRTAPGERLVRVGLEPPSHADGRPLGSYPAPEAPGALWVSVEKGRP